MERIRNAIALAWQALRRWVAEAEANYQTRVAHERTHCFFCGQGPENGVRVCEMCNRCSDTNCNAGCIFCRGVPARPETCPRCHQELPC